MTAIALNDNVPDTSLPSSASPDRLSETPRALANRQNAQKSTGPRTQAGKAKSSKNAAKHGLFSLTPPPELDSDPLFLTIEQELRDQLHPRSATEHTLLRQLAIQSWRLAQLPDYERDALANLPDDADELTTLTRIWSLHDRAQSRYQSLLRQFRKEQDASNKQRQHDLQNEPKPIPEWRKQEMARDAAQERQRLLVNEFNAQWHASQELLRQRCELRNEPTPPYNNDEFLAAQDAYLADHGSPNLFSRNNKRNEAKPPAPSSSPCLSVNSVVELPSPTPIEPAFTQDSPPPSAHDLQLALRP